MTSITCRTATHIGLELTYYHSFPHTVMAYLSVLPLQFVVVAPSSSPYLLC